MSSFQHLLSSHSPPPSLPPTVTSLLISHPSVRRSCSLAHRAPQAPRALDVFLRPKSKRKQTPPLADGRVRRTSPVKWRWEGAAGRSLESGRRGTRFDRRRRRDDHEHLGFSLSRLYLTPFYVLEALALDSTRVRSRRRGAEGGETPKTLIGPGHACRGRERVEDVFVR